MLDTHRQLPKLLREAVEYEARKKLDCIVDDCMHFDDKILKFEQIQEMKHEIKTLPDFLSPKPITTSLHSRPHP